VEDDGGVREIATRNLEAWKWSGIVKMLKYYSDDDDDDAKCVPPKEHQGKVIAVGGGANLPRLMRVRTRRCRCYFRPWDIVQARPEG
jgi:hypothetical protein